MSIIFTNNGGINQNKLRLAYNNDVLRFYSDINTSPVVYAEVWAKAGMGLPDTFRVRLYPDPGNRFFLNLKPYISAIINTTGFEDTLQTNLQTPNPNSFIYSANAGKYLAQVLYIKVFHEEEDVFSSSSYSLAWIGGVEQISESNAFLKTDLLLLTPFKKDSANSYYLKYWEGYPFDVTIYNVFTRLSEDVVTFLNQTNGISQSFRPPLSDMLFGQVCVTRLFFSDGRTDEAIETILPVIEGTNDIKISSYNKGEDDIKYLILEKSMHKCGVYFKWLNKYGGYNYWLFEDTAAIDRSSKQLGELERDNANVEETRSRTIQIGKESQDTIRVVAELLTEEQRRVVEGIIDAPKIYMFTGKPFAQNDYNDWVEVSLKTSNVRVKNHRQGLTNFALDFELPIRYTQTL